MQWNAWGSAEAATELSPGIRGLLSAALGIEGDPTPGVASEAVAIPDSRLDDAALGELAAIVGPQAVSRERDDRLLRAGGRSTPDLLRRRMSHQMVPDAVIAPADDDEVAAVLRWAESAGVAVVPLGGGTGVVGGTDPQAGPHHAVLSLDLGRFDALIHLDEISGIATFGAGVGGPRAEELLGAHGLSLGHFPQSFEFATIGGFAATRSSGQASAGYGRFDDMVVGLTVVTPRGILRLGDVARSAAGPDLRQLMLGSEGVLGVITSVSVRVHRAPTTSIGAAWRFPDFATGAAALRALAQRGAGLGPTVLRLSDEMETGVNLASPGAIGEATGGGCLAVTRFDGDEAACLARAELTAATLAAAGGQSLGAGPADAWEHGRFRAPYLRDALLAVGAGCETLETATTWSALMDLRTAVTDALLTALQESGSRALVLCHISHTYPTGASLYFTVVYALGDDPVTQWAHAKAAACEAIVAQHATISHHHAIGMDHRPWLHAEIGAVGVQILRTLKATLDPAAVLNPGKLIP
ncbi:FAD-binding oxidoreductase [Williamsia sp. CHRR-6]|nr:FAD-binding oxidoreductase [Williamsia sp. CHRR-6]